MCIRDSPLVMNAELYSNNEDKLIQKKRGNISSTEAASMSKKMKMNGDMRRLSPDEDGDEEMDIE